MASQALSAARTRVAFQFLPPAGRILDVGCNDGSMSLRLLEMGYEVVGVDLPKVVSRARQQLADLFFVGVDASAGLPFKNSSIDVVLALEVIEHLPNDVYFLSECRRVLKKSGRLILSTPNLAFVRDRVYLLLGQFIEDPAHVHNYTFPALRRKLVAAGFRLFAERGAVYDLGGTSYLDNVRLHWRIHGKQNALWYALECLLPQTCKSQIVMCAEA